MAGGECILKTDTVHSAPAECEKVLLYFTNAYALIGLADAVITRLMEEVFHKWLP